jgi:hypothetical protein
MISADFSITSKRSKYIQLRVKAEFSIFAKSNKSFIRFKSIVEENMEFFKSISISYLFDSTIAIPLV